jgi:predicted DNA-binding antitoxin AbrB/MazE fold protein
MSEEFQAIYEFGVLRLDKPLALPEQTRVSGVLQNVEDVTSASQLDAPLSLEEFDRSLDQLSLDVPPLPADFSRADIYMDHD